MRDAAQIFETINLGLIIVDRDLKVRAWNRWMESHSGISEREILDQSLLDHYPDLTEPKFNRFIKSVLTFGSYAYFAQKLHQYLIPMKNPHASAADLPFMQQNCAAGPIRNEQGAIISAYITVQDVSEYVVYEHRLMEMGRLDPLTKLFNRSYLDRRLSEEIERARRFGSTFSVVMIDIDFFKKVNDTHGHLCGDHTLRLMAEVLQNSVRKIDFVGRYGGEEFCCVLPEVSAANAGILAERLRLRIMDTPVTYLDAMFGITISLGVAEYSTGRTTLEQIVAAADVALYEAKHTGRNRVVVSLPVGTQA